MTVTEFVHGDTLELWIEDEDDNRSIHLVIVFGRLVQFHEKRKLGRMWSDRMSFFRLLVSLMKFSS